MSYGRVQHVRSFEIKSEASAPVDLWWNIQPVQQLTDQEKLLSSAQPRLCRNRLLGRSRRQLSECEIAAGMRVCHFGFRHGQVARTLGNKLHRHGGDEWILQRNPFRVQSRLGRNYDVNLNLRCVPGDRSVGASRIEASRENLKCRWLSCHRTISFEPA